MKVTKYNDWEIGDWIIPKNGYKKGEQIPIKIVNFRERKTDKRIVIEVIASEKGMEVIVSIEFFRLATEFEIKKELIRRAFINERKKIK
jgi:hypothetical protein